MRETKKPVVVKITETKYVAEDGTEFNNKAACREHEKKIAEDRVFHIPTIDCQIPYGEDNYNYIWNYLKVPEDADLLCAYYKALDKDNDLTIELDTYPQWICLQTNEEGTAWFVDTFDGLKDEFSKYIGSMENLFLNTK